MKIGEQRAGVVAPVVARQERLDVRGDVEVDRQRGQWDLRVGHAGLVGRLAVPLGAVRPEMGGDRVCGGSQQRGGAPVGRRSERDRGSAAGIERAAQHVELLGERAGHVAEHDEQPIVRFRGQGGGAGARRQQEPLIDRVKQVVAAQKRKLAEVDVEATLPYGVKGPVMRSGP